VQSTGDAAGRGLVHEEAAREHGELPHRLVEPVEDAWKRVQFWMDPGRHTGRGGDHSDRRYSRLKLDQAIEDLKEANNNLLAFERRLHEVQEVDGQARSGLLHGSVDHEADDGEDEDPPGMQRRHPPRDGGTSSAKRAQAKSIDERRITAGHMMHTAPSYDAVHLAAFACIKCGTPSDHAQSVRLLCHTCNGYLCQTCDEQLHGKRVVAGFNDGELLCWAPRTMIPHDRIMESAANSFAPAALRYNESLDWDTGEIQSHSRVLMPLYNGGRVATVLEAVAECAGGHSHADIHDSNCTPVVDWALQTLKLSALAGTFEYHPPLKLYCPICAAGQKQTDLTPLLKSTWLAALVDWHQFWSPHAATLRPLYQRQLLDVGWATIDGAASTMVGWRQALLHLRLHELEPLGEDIAAHAHRRPFVAPQVDRRVLPDRMEDHMFEYHECVAQFGRYYGLPAAFCVACSTVSRSWSVDAQRKSEEKGSTAEHNRRSKARGDVVVPFCTPTSTTVLPREVSASHEDSARQLRKLFGQSNVGDTDMCESMTMRSGEGAKSRRRNEERPEVSGGVATIVCHHTQCLLVQDIPPTETVVSTLGLGVVLMQRGLRPHVFMSDTMCQQRKFIAKRRELCDGAWLDPLHESTGMLDRMITGTNAAHGKLHVPTCLTTQCADIRIRGGSFQHLPHIYDALEGGQALCDIPVCRFIAGRVYGEQTEQLNSTLQGDTSRSLQYMTVAKRHARLGAWVAWRHLLGNTFFLCRLRRIVKALPSRAEAALKRVCEIAGRNHALWASPECVDRIDAMAVQEAARLRREQAARLHHGQASGGAGRARLDLEEVTGAQLEEDGAGMPMAAREEPAIDSRWMFEQVLLQMDPHVFATLLGATNHHHDELMAGGGSSGLERALRGLDRLPLALAVPLLFVLPAAGDLLVPLPSGDIVLRITKDRGGKYLEIRRGEETRMSTLGQEFVKLAKFCLRQCGPHGKVSLQERVLSELQLAFADGAAWDTVLSAPVMKTIQEELWLIVVQHTLSVIMVTAEAAVTMQDRETGKLRASDRSRDRSKQQYEEASNYLGELWTLGGSMRGRKVRELLSCWNGETVSPWDNLMAIGRHGEQANVIRATLSTDVLDINDGCTLHEVVTNAVSVSGGAGWFQLVTAVRGLQGQVAEILGIALDLEAALRTMLRRARDRFNMCVVPLLPGSSEEYAVWDPAVGHPIQDLDSSQRIESYGKGERTIACDVDSAFDLHVRWHGDDGYGVTDGWTADPSRWAYVAQYVVGGLARQFRDALLFAAAALGVRAGFFGACRDGSSLVAAKVTGWPFLKDVLPHVQVVNLGMLEDAGTRCSGGVTYVKVDDAEMGDAVQLVPLAAILLWLADLVPAGADGGSAADSTEWFLQSAERDIREFVRMLQDKRAALWVGMAPCHPDMAAEGAIFEHAVIDISSCRSTRGPTTKGARL
jgi:hypothetical protein